MTDAQIQRLQSELTTLRNDVRNLQDQLRKLTGPGSRVGLDGSLVMEAIKDWERRNGPAWRK